MFWAECVVHVCIYQIFYHGSCVNLMFSIFLLYCLIISNKVKEKEEYFQCLPSVIEKLMPKSVRPLGTSEFSVKCISFSIRDFSSC